MIPPDFTTFWTQARQQGLRPKICTITKALLFPSSVESVGQTANNLSTEVWWSPTFPYKSSLTGQSATAACVGLYEGDRKAMDAANRIRPFALRSCLRYSQAECRCAGCCGQSGCLAQNQFGDDRRSDWLGQRTNEKRRKDSACKRAMAARFGWPFQVRSCHRR